MAEYPEGGRSHRAGKNLPEPYLIFLLLVDLLEFPHYGQDEKVAWKIPVEFEGRVLHVEHRKFGPAVFSYESRDVDQLAVQLVRRINKAVLVAKPYFELRAQQAVSRSEINVVNRSIDLFDRFEYLRDLYLTKLAELENRRKDVESHTTPYGSAHSSFPKHQLRREARWLAVSVIESFFGWSDHVFVLLAILQSKCVNGEETQRLVKCSWEVKFKAALDLGNNEIKRHYDRLVSLRRKIRHFLAHGAFGKKWESFRFHSDAGAVPAKFPDRNNPEYYDFAIMFDDIAATHRPEIDAIDRFIEHIKFGKLAPAWIYLDSGLNLVLSDADDGTFQAAMESVAAMEVFTEERSFRVDQLANMDW